VRSGTPKEICDSIEAANKIICNDPLLKNRLADLVSTAVGSTGAEFNEFVAAERAKWGKLITELKIKIGD
jgi:tripartite-type tricarboxylate transporter receptor subunit TctC